MDFINLLLLVGLVIGLIYFKPRFMAWYWEWYMPLSWGKRVVLAWLLLVPGFSGLCAIFGLLVTGLFS
ncbi:MAG: hypothetical protein ACC700_15140 [Anaerolineales bacterium]